MSSPKSFKKKDNEARFKKTYISLRVGINRYYYREHPRLREILNIYDENFYEYIHMIYDLNIATLCRFIQQYERKIMYHNLLNLYLLFFLIDYRKIDRTDMVKINDFIYYFMEEGFQNESGRGDFQPHWDGYFAKMGLSREFFPTFSLLGDYEFKHSLFYMKDHEVVNKRVSSPTTVHEEMGRASPEGEVVLSVFEEKNVKDKGEEVMVPVMKEVSSYHMNQEKIYLTQIQNLVLEIQMRNQIIERYEKEIQLKNQVIHCLGLENQQLKESISKPVPSFYLQHQERAIWHEPESKMEFDKSILDSFEDFFK
jgi:hypothetical protein